MLSDEIAQPSASKFLFWYFNPLGDIAATVELEYIQARFGLVVDSDPHRLLLSYPISTACSKDEVNLRGKGTVLVVKRGGCSFVEKARCKHRIYANQYSSFILHLSC